MRKHSKAMTDGAAWLIDESRAPSRWWIVWEILEGVLLTVGLALAAIYGAVRLEGYLGAKTAVASFTANEPSAFSAADSNGKDLSSIQTDFSGWNQNRIRAYEQDQSIAFRAPMAVLQIPKIHLAAPLLDGTDDLTLNHAVGRIKGTARPGEQGNIGIAGHRDGFFRGLKDVRLGDAIELRTVIGTSIYVVDQIRIVNPDNVGVLRPRPVDSLTLVTCYPFYFIGSAPQRYIVMASLTHGTSSGSGSSMPDSDSPTSNTKKEKQ